MRSMVYLTQNNTINTGVFGVLSTGDVMKELGVTKVTLYEWIKKGLIKPVKIQDMGKRKIKFFDEKEIAKFKKKLPSWRGSGRHLITEFVMETNK